MPFRSRATPRRQFRRGRREEADHPAFRRQEPQEDGIVPARVLDEENGVEVQAVEIVHAQHALAKKQMSGFGQVVTFEIAGGKAAAFRFLNALRLIRISNNLGDAKSLITHPATTTHQRLKPEARAELGITDGMLRLSVGLEAVADLTADLDAALAAAG